MVKDAHGVDINIGDIVQHIYGPFPEKFMDEYYQDKGNPRWRSDGFAGKRTVQELFTTCVEVDTIDRKIPVYLGCYLKVQQQVKEE